MCNPSFNIKDYKRLHKLTLFVHIFATAKYTFVNYWKAIMDSKTELSTNKKCSGKIFFLAFNFISDLLHQGYAIFIIATLIGLNQKIFAILFTVNSCIPGFFTMLHQFQSDNRIWNWKVLTFCVHPINLIIWPFSTIFSHSEQKIKQLKVCFLFLFHLWNFQLWRKHLL